MHNQKERIAGNRVMEAYADGPTVGHPSAYVTVLLHMIQDSLNRFGAKDECVLIQMNIPIRGGHAEHRKRIVRIPSFKPDNIIPRSKEAGGKCR
jgi:hypothetical protein